MTGGPGGAGGFDRIPPRRERADPDPQGRAALFSVPPGAGGQHPGGGFGLAVTCATCRVTSPVSPLGLVRALLPFTAVLPWRPDRFLMTCPACRRRTWLRPGLRR